MVKYYKSKETTNVSSPRRIRYPPQIIHTPFFLTAIPAPKKTRFNIFYTLYDISSVCRSFLSTPFYHIRFISFNLLAPFVIKLPAPRHRRRFIHQTYSLVKYFTLAPPPSRFSSSPAPRVRTAPVMRYKPWYKPR